VGAREALRRDIPILGAAPTFTRQLPIGPYIADLACRQAKLIDEIGGSQHIGSRREETRTGFLRSETGP
jgi:very-short-patch-repair endonuclease